METILKLESDIEIMRERIADYKKLNVEYHDFLKSLRCADLPSDALPSKIIWTCWLQGVEKMPPLVKTCHRVLAEKFADWTHILITQDNLEQYITLDKIFTRKWRKGIISSTAFSNMVRLDLLENYGGIWIDATVLVTGKDFPEYVTRTPFFMYSSWHWLCGDVRPVSTWFIASCKNHPLLKLVKSLLEKYWLDKNYLQTYFIFHMFFRMAITEHPQIFESVPKVSNVPPHFMQFELQKKYCAKRFAELKTLSPIHKLTYKLPEKVLASRDTLYAYLINEGSEL